MPVSVSLWAVNSAIRIASLDLCADEYLLMFARREQIVSVSRLAADRHDSPLWRVARGLPTNHGRIEDLVAVRPTHILTTGGGGKSTAAIAAIMGVRTVAIPYPSAIADVARNVDLVAKMAGNPGASTRWRSKLTDLERSKPRLVLSAYVGQGGVTVSNNSLAAQWMRLAGFQQVEVKGGRLSLEGLAVAAPPVLLRSTYRRAQLSRGQQWLGHPLLARTTARTVDTDGRPWTCVGPLMPYEISRLRRVR